MKMVSPALRKGFQMISIISGVITQAVRSIWVGRIPAGVSKAYLSAVVVRAYPQIS